MFFLTRDTECYCIKDMSNGNENNVLKKKKQFISLETREDT